MITLQRYFKLKSVEIRNLKHFRSEKLNLLGQTRHMDNRQQLCRVSKRYTKIQKYRYINLTKFKKLFVRTICYVHVVTRIVTRILSDTLISANLERVACKFS